jgi:hypothetical protein
MCTVMCFVVCRTQNKDSQSKMKDERRRYSDLESKLKEDSVHARIKDAEKSQVGILKLL